MALASSGEVTRALASEGSPLTSIAVSGDFAITSSADCVTRIWHLEKAVCAWKLTGHTAAVVSAAFSPDGKNVITASLDRTAKLWRLIEIDYLQTLVGKSDYVSTVPFAI